jgi:hypothetical protein
MPVWLIVLIVLAVAFLFVSVRRRRRGDARRLRDLSGSDGTINVGERWRTGGYMEGGGGG